METRIAQAVGLIIATVLIFLILKLFSLAKKYVDERALNTFISTAVHGVQQMAHNYGWDNAEKKQRVLVQVEQWLCEHGINISKELMEIMIESAVNMMKENQGLIEIIGGEEPVEGAS